MAIAPTPPTAPPPPTRNALWGLLAWAVAACVLALYLSTAAPNPWWGDGCELATAAKVLGIAHPTGYPLYTILAHMAIRLLGWMEPGGATTAFNAILLAAACGLMASLLVRARPSRSAGAFLGAAGLAAMAAVARTVWEHATLTEVYPLTYFFCLAVLSVAWNAPGRPPGPRRAAALGALMGLASLNHYSILSYYPLTGLIVLEWTRRRGWRVRLGYIATTIGCWLAMLGGYAYLPLRARLNPPLNWGDPRTLEQLRWVLTGGQFRTVNAIPGLWQGGPLSGTLRWIGFWGEQWQQGPQWLGLALGLVIVAPAIAGLVVLARRRPGLGGGLLMVLVATLCFSIFYHIRDIEAYIMPALPAVAIGWMEAVRFAIGRRGRGLPRWLAAAPLALAALVAAGQYRAIDKSWDTAPTDYAKAVLDALPPGAVVMALGDNSIFSLWYAQTGLGQRPDVTVIGTNFLNERWYRRYFEAAGRPGVPLRIADRGNTIPSKFVFELGLLRDVIIPCFQAGKRVFVLYSNPADFDVLAQFFSPTLVTNKLPPGNDYRRKIKPEAALPEPVMWELHPNPALAALPPEKIARQLAEFYAKSGQAVQRP